VPRNRFALGDPAIPFDLARYEGIGGWLILVVIGLAMGIFSYAKTAWLVLDPIFNLTKWNMLTAPGSLRYEPYWAPTLVFESSGAVVLLVFSILATVLMSQKRFTFPKVMIAVLAGNLVYHLIDYALASHISSLAQSNQLVSQNAFRFSVSCAIWIPYFLVSKRVKATFRF
jgi:hypothetical protein